MRKLLIYICSCAILFLSSCFSKTSEKIKLSVLSTEINVKDGDSIIFNLKNTSSKKQIVYCDLSRYNYFIKDSRHPIDNIGITLQISNQDSEVVDLDKRHIQFEYSTEENIIYRELNAFDNEKKKYLKKYANILKKHDTISIVKWGRILENSILIENNSSKNIKLNIIPFNTPESYILQGYYGYNLDNHKNYFAKVRLEIDSSRIKSLLKKEYLDSLNQNGIEIFNGVLESNKIPLIYDKNSY